MMESRASQIEERHLVREYERFLEANHLPKMSADELIHERLTPSQRRWVSDFIVRWEAWMKRSHPPIRRDFVRPMGAGSEVRRRERTSEMQGDGYRENGAKMRGNIHNWITALSFFERYRRGSEAKLGHNTVLRTRSTGVIGSDDVQVVLHDTPIVTYHADATVTLNSGGWQSVTTKARMNEVLPMHVRVSQTKGQWFVSDRTGGAPIKFFDGMRIRIE